MSTKPDTPNAPDNKYVITEQGKAFLMGRRFELFHRRDGVEDADAGGDCPDERPGGGGVVQRQCDIPGQGAAELLLLSALFVREGYSDDPVHGAGPEDGVCGRGDLTKTLTLTITKTKTLTIT